MSVEVEAKYRVHALAPLRAKLAALSAAASAPVRLEDVYYSHPGRDFAATHEALRIRSEDGVGHVTYKGPPKASQVKARDEIEIALGPSPADKDGMAAILRHLGFGVIAAVRKERTSFAVPGRRGDLTVVLDQVESLGPFVEIEAVVAGDASVAEAEAEVLALAATLGLTSREPRSYLEMVLASPL